MKKKVSLLATLLVVAVVFTGCSFTVDKNATGTDGATTGGTSTSAKELKLYVETEITDMNQWTASDNISFSVLNNVTEGLYRLDVDNEPQPAMAEAVDISEDKLTYTFKLRDNANWSDGTPVTAADFKYSWLRGMNPAIGTNGYSFILNDYIVGAAEYAAGGSADQVAIDATDDKTLVVTLKQPTPYFLRLTSFIPYFPMKEEFVVSKGDKFALNPENMLFNGPYTLTTMDAASGAVLSKNEGYWDAANVKVNKVDMKVIKEKSTAMNAYKAGQLDRVLLTSSDVDANQSDPGFGTGIEFKTTYLQFNTTADGVSNVNIRKALSLAYDSNLLADQVLNNGSKSATGLIPFQMSGVDGKSFRDMQGDLLKADTAQAKAYWEQGVKELGKTPTITMLVADNSETKDVATFMQSEFKKNLGIDVVIDTKTAKARGQLMDNSQYQMAITGWGADYDDAMTYLDLWANHTPYRGNYENADFDALISGAKQEADEAKRIDMLLQAERLLVSKDVVVSPIFFGGYSYLLNEKVEGLVYHPYGSPVDFKYTDIK
ncbi:peptide ABC transporter substrate-binding protein [Paenibacillus sp. Marseille-Q4541]|uniref:peptide ABC transporter substrate-binding protein n=1 Tax=Paenibacillus sp. Marseille-Q4541 TaxID=2831522 RepID=UPI001BA96DBA|nr:peptide ABC transporter substrate-binding protein [Paenibacillus sp. Marseille-Q4541]